MKFTVPLSTLTILFSTNLMAGGYQIVLPSASGLGTAFSNGVASGDASVIATNPAAMAGTTQKKTTVGIGYAQPDLKVSVSNANLNLGSFGLKSVQGGRTSQSNTTGGAAIPHVFSIYPVNKSLTVGFGAFTNFGSQTNYDDDFLGRLNALQSKVQTINLNPSVAYSVTKKWSLGFGVNAVYANAVLTSANPGFAAVKNTTGGNLLGPDGEIVVAPNGSTLGSSKVSGDDWDYGWNAGVVYQLTDHSRVGLSYRSKVSLSLQGQTEFEDTPDAPPFEDFAAEAPLELPDMVSMSGQFTVAEGITASGDMTLTRWSNFERLEVLRKDSGAVATSVKEDWQDSMRYSIGLDMIVNDAWSVRGGLAYDESPIRQRTMTLRMPRGDTVWMTLGGQYRLSETWTLDGGYAYLQMQDVEFTDVREFVGQPFTSNAEAKASMTAHIVAMQMTVTL